MKQNEAPNEVAKRYPLADERHGLTNRVEIYTNYVDDDGKEVLDEKTGYPAVKVIKVYFTVNCYADGKTPGEVFTYVGKTGHDQHGWPDAWATTISLLLQHGIDPRRIVDKFKFVDFIPSGITNCPAVPMCKSIPDLIVRYIEHKFLSEPDDGYDATLDAVAGGEDR